MATSIFNMPRVCFIKQVFQTLMIALLLTALVSNVAQAQDETLQEALRQAYQSNPSLKAERARFSARKELKAQAWANAMPRVIGSASYTRVDNTQTVSAAFFDELGLSERKVKLTTLAGTVEAEHVIFSGFKNMNAIKQARARIDAGGAQLVFKEQEILKSAAIAYLNVVRDTQIFLAKQQNVETLLKEKKESEIKNRVGSLTRTDVAQTEARLAAARADLSDAQTKLTISRATYEEWIGIPPGELEENPAMPDYPENINAATALAVEYAPDVLIALANERASKREIDIARGDLLPKISIVSSYDYANEPSSFVEAEERLAYGARLSIPLFSGGSKLSRIREAKSLNKADINEIYAAKRRVKANVSAVWAELQAAKMKVDSAKIQLRASKLALDGVRRESELGSRTTIDVLNAEQEYLSARLLETEARRDEQVSIFSLLAAIGILTTGAL